MVAVEGGSRGRGDRQLALIGSSSPLHPEACNALGTSDGVIHRVAVVMVLLGEVFGRVGGDSLG